MEASAVKDSSSVFFWSPEPVVVVAVMVTSWDTQEFALSATAWASASETFGGAVTKLTDTSVEVREVAACSAAVRNVEASMLTPSEPGLTSKVSSSSPRVTPALWAAVLSEGMRELA